MNRKKLLLAILLLLLAVSVVSAYLRWPRQKTVSSVHNARPSAVAKPRGAAPAAAAAPDDRFVRLDLLRREGQRFSGFRRNIFQLSAAAGRHAGQHVLTVLKPPPPPPPGPQAAPTPVSQPTAARRDLARFTFLGFLQKDGVTTVFLSKDKKILLVKKGDRIEGKYLATGLTDNALTIRVVSDGTEVVVPLREHRPLISRP